jgi:hypothetical protein
MITPEQWTSIFGSVAEQDSNSFELQPLTLPDSAHPAATSLPTDFLGNSRFCSTKHAVTDARIQTAARLWPAELLGAASSFDHSKTEDSHHNSGGCKSTKVSSHPDAEHAEAAKKPVKHGFRNATGVISEFMQASFHTAASKVTGAATTGKLSQPVIDAVSQARKEIENYLSRKGLSTQGTTPFRQRVYPAGKLDPRMVKTPLYPPPHSLEFIATPSVATDLGHPLTPEQQRAGSSRASNLPTVASTVELLEATQRSEISAWREHERPNKEIADMLKNFGLLGPAYTGATLGSGRSESLQSCPWAVFMKGWTELASAKAVHRAAVDLLCWTFKRGQGEGDTPDDRAACGERMEGMIKRFERLNTGEYTWVEYGSYPS